MHRFGKPARNRNRCTFHPLQEVVGICASCLRERLVSLARANYEQRRSEIVYKPDPSSWGYLRFRKKNYDDVEGTRDLDLTARAKPQNDKYSSDEKKRGKVNLSGLRSFLGFLKKRDCRNNVSVRERQENKLLRRKDGCGDVQDSWEPSVSTKTGCASSTRRSVSERRRSSKGPGLRRSTSSYHNYERDHDEMEDSIESDCEKDEGKLINLSDSLVRCRIEAKDVNPK